jgi:hypothetical protein
VLVIRRPTQQIEGYESGDILQVCIAFLPNHLEVGFVSEFYPKPIHGDEHL